MGQAIALDTHAYVKKLRSVGFTEEQAEVQAETLVVLLDERLATKENLKELEIILRREIKELETTLRREIEVVKREIVEAKLETIKWVAGMLIGQALLIIGVLKFL